MQKQIVEYDIKSRYPEEYWTVDKVGRKRFLARNSVELVASPHFLSYLQARLAAFMLRASLF